MTNTIRIRIAGVDYEVVEFDSRLNRNLMGEEVYAESKIYIADNLPPDKKRETLLHEIMHIIYQNCYLQPGDEEERVVSALSTGLYQVLADNFLEKYVDNSN